MKVAIFAYQLFTPQLSAVVTCKKPGAEHHI
jgi:hypothetical protein